MPTFSYRIECSDDGEIWMPEADAIGTGEYDGTAADYARGILANRLADGDTSGPVDLLRVVVTEGPMDNMSAPPAATVYA